MAILRFEVLTQYCLQHLKRQLFFLGSFFWRRSHWVDISKEQRKSLTYIERIPAESWDSHMHVVDPVSYSLSPDAKYTPSTHNLSDALEFEKTVGLRNIVLIQPSIYGNDNECMLEALRSIGSRRGRAVVAFDPKTIRRDILDEWHQLGVRGVRVNVQSTEKDINIDEFSALLRSYAEIIRPLNWVLQLYIPLTAIKSLEELIPQLNVTVCIDHFGYPKLPKIDHTSIRNPYSIPGFESLARLLKGGNTYVKISAPYRIPGNKANVEVIGKELLRIAGKDRVVFATDWPHTRFEGLDIRPFQEQVLEWCGSDSDLIDCVFRRNAQDLWDAQR